MNVDIITTRSFSGYHFLKKKYDVGKLALSNKPIAQRMTKVRLRDSLAAQGMRIVRNAGTKIERPKTVVHFNQFLCNTTAVGIWPAI